MKKGREKLSEEEVRMVVKAVKEMPVDNIILIPSSKNRTFMSDYKMEEKRWKVLLKTLKEDEYAGTYFEILEIEIEKTNPSGQNVGKEKLEIVANYNIWFKFID